MNAGISFHSNERQLVFSCQEASFIYLHQPHNRQDFNLLKKKKKKEVQGRLFPQ